MLVLMYMIMKKERFMSNKEIDVKVKFGLKSFITVVAILFVVLFVVD